MLVNKEQIVRIIHEEIPGERERLNAAGTAVRLDVDLKVVGVRRNSHPPYMGVSAIGFRQLYSVIYGEGNTFTVCEDSRPFSAIVAEASSSGKSAVPVAWLASELEAKCRDRIWVT